MKEQTTLDISDITPRQKADLLRRVIELLAPDLKSFYPTTIKGRIEKVYTTNDRHFYCDVQPLNNDESIDEDKPVINHIEIPVMFAGPDRGIICQPVVGLICDITYFGGDENYPGISNLRYANNKVPNGVFPGELLIQKGPGNYLKFGNGGSREECIPGKSFRRIGRDKIETVGGSSKSFVSGNREEIAWGNHETQCEGNLKITVEKGISIESAPFTVEAAEGIELSAAGSLTAGGATTNLVSEDTFTLLSAGSMGQFASGPFSQRAASLKQELTNISISPSENVYQLDALAGNYKVNLVAGNYDVDILAGVFNLSNSVESLRGITENLYETINEAFVKLGEICETINQLNVGTGVGPSSTPLNSGDFVEIMSQIESLKATLESDKTALGLFFK